MSKIASDLDSVACVTDSAEVTKGNSDLIARNGMKSGFPLSTTLGQTHPVKVGQVVDV